MSDEPHVMRDYPNEPGGEGAGEGADPAPFRRPTAMTISNSITFRPIVLLPSCGVLDLADPDPSSWTDEDLADAWLDAMASSRSFGLIGERL